MRASEEDGDPRFESWNHGFLKDVYRLPITWSRCHKLPNTTLSLRVISKRSRE